MTPAASAAVRYTVPPFGVPTDAGFARLERTYARLLDWSLSHRPVVLVVAAASLVFGLSLLATGAVGVNFFPASDDGTFLVDTTVPAGTTLATHDAIMRQVEERLLAIPEVETVSATDAIKLANNDHVVIVDIRDPREIERDGRIPGAFSCTRGMLEFWIDPSSPYAKPIFQQDKKFIFHCAGGMRSALAAKTAQDMGLKPVAHIGGGFAAWRDAGGPVEKWEPRKPKA